MGARSRVMQAVLLAAGKGSRLHPLTSVVPKPLVQVAGKPIIEYLMDSLDVEEYIIVIGHLGEQIQQYYGENYAGTPIRYVTQHELNGTAGALKVALPFLRSNFLVLNTDDLYAPRDIQQLCEQPSILVKNVDDVRSYAEIILDDGVPSKIVEKPVNPVSNLANIGAYHFPLRAVDFVERVPLSIRGEYEITDVVQMCFDRKLLSYTVATFWQPVGTVDQLFQAHKVMKALPYIAPTSKVVSHGDNIIVYDDCDVRGHIDNCIVSPMTILEPEDLHADTVIYKNHE